MKRLFFSGIIFIIAVICVYQIISIYIFATIPTYKDNIGNNNYQQKMSGQYLLEQSAKLKDNVIIYGSSELRTTNISTHPSNFFKNKRSGFQVNIIGRGSCQSIIHAMSIAASKDSLKNTKVVLITSPQSYVRGGIAPDLFMANFSQQQYINIMLDNNLSSDIKIRIKTRVNTLINQYENDYGKLSSEFNLTKTMQSTQNNNLISKLEYLLLSPYFILQKNLLNLKDANESKTLLNNYGIAYKNKAYSDKKINWQDEEKKAIIEGKEASSNNDFGILNDYYNTNIGAKLLSQKNRDKNLSYTNSVEYDDLKLLLDICKEKGIKPLFISVPLNGKWSDYTGFIKEKRQEYYNKVRGVVDKYDATLLDLTSYEYDEYFLCDVMHLGWKGWLKADEAIDRFYHTDNR